VAALLELAMAQTVFLAISPLVVDVELTEDVGRKRRIEVVGNAHTPTPASRCASLTHGAQRDEPGNGVSGLGDDDLLTRLGAINELGKTRLCFVDVDVLGHRIHESLVKEIVIIGQVSQAAMASARGPKTARARVGAYETCAAHPGTETDRMDLRGDEHVVLGVWSRPLRARA
jgi:hypothetical protein